VTEAAEENTTAPPRERHGLEILAVLGVSLGISALDALLSLIRDELTLPGGIASANKCIECPPVSTHQWLDLADQLLGILNGVVPPLLALLLLARSPGGRGFGIGFDLRLPRREVMQGIGFTALIGIPGLVLVYVANQVGANASLQAVSYPDYWYRIPYLLLSAFQNGFSEEIIVTGFLLTRLSQLGWTRERALITEATLRGTYHLYQGYGGFAGNFVMGLIFGWWFQRTRRVQPLLIAHFLLDAISFIGYVYLHNRLDWI
jgi:membrane protease YdiL (CAAX protease family)